MTKKFTLLQLFSLVDGRLSTKMGDVYDMLNHIFDDDFTTIALPTAMTSLEKQNPKWFQAIKDDLQAVKNKIGDDFDKLIEYIETVYNPTYEIPQLKDGVS